MTYLIALVIGLPGKIASTIATKQSTLDFIFLTQALTLST
jgi:hypothetical protein